MSQKNIKLGYFSLPQKVPNGFTPTFLVLDKYGKIRVKTPLGPEMSYCQFVRSLARGDVTLTKKGENFVKKAKL